MWDISLAGLIGAMVGTALAGVLYHLLIGALEQRISAGFSESVEDRDRLALQLSVVRRVVLIGDIVVFAVLGYVIADSVWG